MPSSALTPKNDEQFRNTLGLGFATLFYLAAFGFAIYWAFHTGNLYWLYGSYLLLLIGLIFQGFFNMLRSARNKVPSFQFQDFTVEYDHADKTLIFRGTAYGPQARLLADHHLDNVNTKKARRH